MDRTPDKSADVPRPTNQVLPLVLSPLPVGRHVAAQVAIHLSRPVAAIVGHQCPQFVHGVRRDSDCAVRHFIR